MSCFGRSPQASQKPHRTIKAGYGDTTLCGNRISTTKYTLINFVPKNLWEQFRRLANFYFLVVAIVQMIPTISTLDPVTSILPLVFVILVTMVKEAAEDLRRWAADNRANAKNVERLKNNVYSQVRWEDLLVGDIVRINSDEAVPADVVVLYSPIDMGMCNIETTNLDGETNLKARQAIQFEGKFIDFEDDPSSFTAFVTVDKPNVALYSFNGSLFMSGEKDIPVDNHNVILRSCSLRNTPYILGLVVYTGPETKIMMNNSSSPIKRTKLEAFLNIFVFIAFATQMLFCIFCTISFTIFLGRTKDHDYLLMKESSAALTGKAFVMFLTFVILFQTLIPISLYVTLEVVKLGQVIFINNDSQMYDAKTDTRANARTSNLNEALGQIEYVFSDKTGTLTQNVMEFFKCSIGGVVFGTGISEIKAAEMRRNGIKDAKPSGRGFEDDTIMGRLHNSKDPLAQKIRDFFTVLALCHTCHAEKPREKEGMIVQPAGKEKGKDKEKDGGKKGGGSGGKSGWVDEENEKEEEEVEEDVEEEEEEEEEEDGGVGGGAKPTTLSMGFDIYPSAGEGEGKGGASVRSSRNTKYSTNAYEIQGASFRNKQQGNAYNSNSAAPTFLMGGLGMSSSARMGSGALTEERKLDNLNDISFDLSQAATTSAAFSAALSGGYDGPLVYKASSPDEGALVQAAAKMGFEFRGKRGKMYVVRMPVEAAQLFTTKLPAKSKNGKEVDVPFEVLHILEFNSDRKRNSVIVRLPDSTIKMFSKGADATMLPLLSPTTTSPGFVQTTNEHMRDFAAEGLRTLVLASRVISEEEYAQWEPTYCAALNVLNDRQKAVDDAAALIERHLELIGATAIEDKLQEGVPDCIEVLRRAGMKIWVLTGDKQETAINIAFACKLLTGQMQMLIVSGSDPKKIRLQIQALAHAFAPVDPAHFMHYALVIEGSALSLCLSDELLSDTLSVCLKCGVVVCCRVSPKQKADVVGAIRDNSEATTLAIGDGANDVPMIQRAHIGVGISGNEGMQAVMASDYSIAQFRFLQRLLLVHGRLSYKRLSLVVLYSFYKNVTFCLTLFWFAWFSGFSGASMFESWYISLFNCVFTVLPVGLYGLADQEIKPDRMQRLPATYALGRLGREATPTTFIIWILDGVYASFVIFHLGVIMLQSPIDSNGRVGDIYFFGNALCTAVVITVTVRILLESNFITFIHVIVAAVSVLSWYVLALLFATGILRDQIKGAFFQNMGSVACWFYVIVAPIVALVPPYVIRYLYRTFKPTVDTVIREKELIVIPRLRSKMHTFGRKGLLLTDKETGAVTYQTKSDTADSQEVGTGMFDFDDAEIEEYALLSQAALARSGSQGELGGPGGVAEVGRGKGEGENNISQSSTSSSSSSSSSSDGGDKTISVLDLSSFVHTGFAFNYTEGVDDYEDRAHDYGFSDVRKGGKKRKSRKK